jgi:Ca-activated chloride channel family protein
MNARRATIAAAALVAGCGGRAPSPPAAAPGATAAPAAPSTPGAATRRPRPAPGIDIEGVPATPAAAATAPATTSTAVPAAPLSPLDLGTDRPVVKISLPRPPAGATAPFALEDGRRGWVARLPHGVAIPTAAWGDGHVFVGGGFETTSFYALDAFTGRVDWSRHTLEDDGPSAPVFADGQIIFNTESCTLIVLDAATGKERWHRWLGDPTLSQPAVADGLVFASFPAGGQRLGAFRLTDGKPVWSRPISGELLSTPVVSGDSVYATTVAGTTYRFRRTDGARLWAVSHAGSSAPWVAGGEVHLSRLAAGAELQIVLDAATGAVKRTVRRAKAAWAGDVPRTTADWKHVWSFEGSRPVVAGGRRFDTMGGEIHASDLATGAPLWIRRYAAGAGKHRLTAPAVAGAQLFFSTYDGDLYALDVDTGMTVWAYGLGAHTGFQPIVARGWVYVTTGGGSVIGLGLADSTLDGWHAWGGNAARDGLTL